ncbi:methionine adenosyltransferase [Fontibacter flavus]|uniref:Methionine adenosyltransferase n=1 Tax=Fontibacter flavus TaxID=654838 RepID=A0ABV6FPZ9_9BACT
MSLSKSNIFIQQLPGGSKRDFEIVERKGIGHPDTICDEIAEAVSRALSRYYLEHFGSILHHNVDKALLVGGSSEPYYAGGKMRHPIELYIAGRATSQVGDKFVPVEEIAIRTAKNWLKEHLRYVDVVNDIRIIPKIRSGSQDLVELFQRFGLGEVPLSNDTSFGVGFYPFSALEKKVLEIDQLLREPTTLSQFPCIGEDTKIMGVYKEGQFLFTLAIAMVDRHLANLAEYKSKIEEIKAFVANHVFIDASCIFINTADDYQKESIYLTVTGCSAENGDDGQVGRGNRANGLITPYRPMSLEATAGKNPISHVGKIYNLWANELSKAICLQGFAEEAEVFIVSQIGKPITEPTLLEIRLKNAEASEDEVRSFASGKLLEIPQIWEKLLFPS